MMILNLIHLYAQTSMDQTIIKEVRSFMPLVEVPACQVQMKEQ